MNNNNICKSPSIILKTDTLSRRSDIEAAFSKEGVYGLNAELSLAPSMSLLENISPNATRPGTLDSLIDDLQLAKALHLLPHEANALTRKKAVLAKAVMACPKTPVYFCLDNSLTAGEKLLFCGLLHSVFKKHGLSARIFYSKESCAGTPLELCA